MLWSTWRSVWSGILESWTFWISPFGMLAKQHRSFYFVNEIRTYLELLGLEHRPGCEADNVKRMDGYGRVMRSEKRGITGEIWGTMCQKRFINLIWIVRRYTTILAGLWLLIYLFSLHFPLCPQQSLQKLVSCPEAKDEPPTLRSSDRNFHSGISPASFDSSC